MSFQHRVRPRDSFWGDSSTRSRDFSILRLRSDGVLAAHDIAQCRASGVELAYDPVQGGFVPANVIDDIAGFSGRRDRAMLLDRVGEQSIAFRRWQASDAPAFVALLGNSRVWTFMPDPQPHLDLSAAIDLITLSNEAAHHDVFAAIVENEPVGQARLLFDLAAFQRGTAEISYWLGEPYWGRGLGSKLVAAFTRLSFERWPDLQTIVAKVHPDNAASRQVLLKSGYRPIESRELDRWQWFGIARAPHRPFY